MFNYLFTNSREYNVLLQFLSLFLLFVIGSMIYYMNNNTDKLKEEISKLEMECPPLPSIPGCPKCPECNCGDKVAQSAVNCPTVDDIVSGIFPGRNTGITSGGKYFDIKANENYELLPDYDIYESVDAFPKDSILSQPLRSGNISVSEDQINNSIENLGINTYETQALSQLGDPSLGNMNMGLIDTVGTEMPEGGSNYNINRATRSKSP